MKGFRLFATAALVIGGVSAQVDPFDRLCAAEPMAAVAEGELPAVGAYAYQDFPPYPPGFSSYRGLGFMGTCCEQLSPCALAAWANYCHEAYAIGPGLHRGSIRPSRHIPLGHTFPRLRGPGFGLFSGGCVGAVREFPGQGDKTAEPIEAEADLDEPIQQVPAPEDPEPHTAGVIVPSLPAPPSLDRSASRADLRRLPSVENSY